MNKVILLGRIGKDPQVRYSNEGKPICNTSLATTERYNGNESTEWHNLVAFGKTAELIEKYVQKGKLIMVEGKISTNKWEDKSGQTRYTTNIIVQNIEFVPSGNNNNQSSQANHNNNSKPKTHKQPSIPNEQPSDFSGPIDDEEYPF